MGLSKSAFEFMQRNGLIDETMRPAPRLAIDDLLINQLPLAPPHQPSQDVLRGYEGDPPPDRAEARPWPNQEAAK